MIKLKLNVSKLDKKKFFKGEKGVYCDLIMIETPRSQYDDWLIRQDTTKEEREQGIRLEPVGNGKNVVLTPQDEAEIPF